MLRSRITPTLANQEKPAVKQIDRYQLLTSQNKQQRRLTGALPFSERDVDLTLHALIWWCDPPPPPRVSPGAWNEMEYRAGDSRTRWCYLIVNWKSYAEWIKLRTLLCPYRFLDVAHLRQSIETWRFTPTSSLCRIALPSVTVKRSADVSQQRRGRIRHESFDSCPLALASEWDRQHSNPHRHNCVSSSGHSGPVGTHSLSFGLQHFHERYSAPLLETSKRENEWSTTKIECQKPLDLRHSQTVEDPPAKKAAAHAIQLGRHCTASFFFIIYFHQKLYFSLCRRRESKQQVYRKYGSNVCLTTGKY